MVTQVRGQLHGKWLALGAAFVISILAGCGKPGAKSSEGSLSGGGGAVSGASTVQTIERAVKADPQLASADIKAAEDRGSISLTGTVATEELKDRAEKIVYDSQRQMKQQPGVWNYLLLPENSGESAAAPTGQIK